METVNVSQLLTLLIFDHVVSLIFVYVMIRHAARGDSLFPRRPESEEETDV